ncbi:MAG: caspase family protein [Lewinellaceae bacterium]|nr:caspase family protein [Lewinellaceae bacterium]
MHQQILRLILTISLLLMGKAAFNQIPQLTIPVGHSDDITTVAFSPDGQYILTAGLDRTAKLWNRQGQELVTFSQHSGYILDATFSPDGQYIITGADDASIILWNLQGQALHTYQGHLGWVRCLAFSPDGQHFISGGLDGQGFMWDLKGRLVQALPAYSAFYNSLDYSEDGQYIVSAVGPLIILLDGKGQLVSQVTQDSQTVNEVRFSPDGQLIAAGTDGGRLMLWSRQGEKIWDIPAHEKGVAAVSFSKDGNKLLSSCPDGSIKIWNKEGQLIRTFSQAPSFNDAEFSPDGTSILSSGPDTAAHLWSLEGEHLQAFRGYAHSVLSVTFTPDGRQFVTGNDDGIARLWLPLQGRLRTMSGHSGPVTDLAYSRDGSFLLTGGGPGKAIFRDADGAPLWETADSLGTMASALSPDGQTIVTGDAEGELYWWNQKGELIRREKGHDYDVRDLAFNPEGTQFVSASNDTRARLWSVQGDSLATFAGHELDLFATAFSADGKSIATSAWDNLLKLWSLDGQERKSIGFKDVINDIAFTKDGNYILVAGDQREALMLDNSGQLTRGFFGHKSGVTSLSLAPQGRFLLTGSRDKTARIWDLYTGVELATLIAVGEEDWVVTTSSGLFDASPGALRRLYYVLGLEVIDLEQLKERYYEPGLLPRLLGLQEGAIRDVDALEAIELYPKVEASIEGNQLSIQLEERNGGIGKVSLFINKKEVLEDANPERQAGLTVDLSDFEKYLLPGRPNEITLRAYNTEGWLKSQPFVLSFDPIGKKGEDKEEEAGFIPSFQPVRDPHLFILCIGTSDYNGERLDLRFPDKDAADMASALSAAGGALFPSGNVHLFLLNTDPGTSKVAPGKENITKCFSDIAREARPEDVFILYLSGHGLTYGSSEKGQFYYLTKDIASEDLSDPTIRANYAISTEEFTQWLTGIPARKQVMMLDACNSGKVVESLLSASRSLNASQIRALDRMQGRTGVFVLSGSAADKVSYEANRYGQGLLTFSLLQGMSGLALREGKYIDIMTLFQYSRDKVPELAEAIGGIQTPMMAFPLGGESFDIGLVDEQVEIPVAQVKPVFIRNVFLEENAFDDVLGLGRRLENHLEQITARGAKASLVYVDVPEYKDAFSIKGLYELKKGKISLKARLFKGREPLGSFEANGQEEQMDELVEEILARVMEIINSR